MLLLASNADTTVINGEGQTAADLAQDKEVKAMLEGNFYFSLMLKNKK